MQNLLKKAGIAGISCLCAFTASSAVNNAASIQNVKYDVAGTETRQAKKIYKYKQDKKQVEEFNSIKADFNSLDIVIKESGDKNFYVSYNLNCSNKNRPLSYKVENGVLSIKEQNLEWPAGYVYISNKNKKIDYRDYTNKIYVYIPSGADLRSYSLDTGMGDVFIKDIAIGSGKIIADSGDIDITIPKITGSMDINTDSGDIDINTDTYTKINTDINGQINIKTDSGDVDIKKSAINKTLNIKTNDGDVGIRKSTINKTLNINTDCGDIDVQGSVINKITNINTDSGDVDILSSSVKEKLGICTVDGDIEAEDLNISGNTDIKTNDGDVDIKLNSKYTSKLGIKMVTKEGDMYVKKTYKGSKREKGYGYEYTRNINGNKEPFLNVLVTEDGDIELR